MTSDHVVLLDPDGSAVGSAPRRWVHSTQTPLHLAYSCYVFDRHGQVLLTRRSLAKRAWPGVWTNSFCGHPRPGETMPAALRRGARHELGIELSGVTTVLADFRYTASDPHGVVENEVCPVFRAVTEDVPVLNPDEAVECAWVRPEALPALARDAGFAFSPWFVLQVAAAESLAVPTDPGRVP